MCRIREWDLYCVRILIRRMPEFRQFDSAKSTIRYLPANGTAGFARQSVSILRREPRPPDSTSASVLRVSRLMNRLVVVMLMGSAAGTITSLDRSHSNDVCDFLTKRGVRLRQPTRQENVSTPAKSCRSSRKKRKLSGRLRQESVGDHPPVDGRCR